MLNRREAIKTFMATTAAMGIDSSEAKAVEIPDKPWVAVLKVPNRLSAEQTDMLKRAWEEIWKGLNPAPKCIVLPDGLDMIVREK